METDRQTHIKDLQDRLGKLAEDYSTLLGMGMVEDAYKVAGEMEAIRQEIARSVR
jgi:hypothetical protein